MEYTASQKISDKSSESKWNTLRNITVLRFFELKKYWKKYWSTEIFKTGLTIKGLNRAIIGGN